MAARIQARLDDMGKTQVWLAKKIDAPQQTINSIMAGKSKQPRQLRQIARALETSQAYLLGEIEDPTDPDAFLAEVWHDIPNEKRGAALDMLIGLARSSKPVDSNSPDK